MPDTAIIAMTAGAVLVSSLVIGYLISQQFKAAERVRRMELEMKERREKAFDRQWNGRAYPRSVTPSRSSPRSSDPAVFDSPSYCDDRSTGSYSDSCSSSDSTTSSSCD